MFKPNRELTPPPGFTSMESFLNASPLQQSAAMSKTPMPSQLHNALAINSPMNPFPTSASPNARLGAGINPPFLNPMTNPTFSPITGMQPSMLNPFASPLHSPSIPTSMSQYNPGFFSPNPGITPTPQNPVVSPANVTTSTTTSTGPNYNYTGGEFFADILKATGKTACHALKIVPGAQVPIMGTTFAISLCANDCKAGPKADKAKVIRDTTAGMVLEGAVAAAHFPTYAVLKPASMLGKHIKSHPELEQQAQKRLCEATEGKRDALSTSSFLEMMYHTSTARAATKELTGQMVFKAIANSEEAAKHFISDALAGKFFDNNNSTKTNTTTTTPTP